MVSTRLKAPLEEIRLLSSLPKLSVSHRWASWQGSLTRAPPERTTQERVREIARNKSRGLLITSAQK